QDDLVRDRDDTAGIPEHLEKRGRAWSERDRHRLEKCARRVLVVSVYCECLVVASGVVCRSVHLYGATFLERRWSRVGVGQVYVVYRYWVLFPVLPIHMDAR